MITLDKLNEFDREVLYENVISPTWVKNSCFSADFQPKIFL